MWRKGDSGQNTIWMDVVARDRTFIVSLIADGRGVFARESQELAVETYSNLTDSLAELTDPQRAPAPEAFQDFGSLLFELALPERIQLELLKHNGPLIFSTHELSLPWELLCDHNGEFLCLQQPFSRQLPTLQRMSDELLGTGQFTGTQAHADAGTLIIANPTGDLQEAAEEAEELKAILEQHDVPCDALIGPSECTFQNILGSHLRRRPYRIIHFSGHAQYLDQGTSAILLADQKKIMAQEIQRTFKGEPMVFLNACWSAMNENTAETPASGYSGANVVRTLAEAFTFGNRSGRVQAIIGSMWWIADTVARGLASHFYTRLLEGNSIGESLRLARRQLSQEVGDPALWSTYVLFGDPDLRLSPIAGESDPVAEEVAPDPATDVAPTRISPQQIEKDEQPLSQVTETPSDETSRDVVEPVEDIAAVPHGDLEDDIPWSDDARTAFVGAMAAMSTMNWNVFSTVHLVLGLTYIDDGLISQALDRNGFDHDAARRSLRELFTFDHEPSVSDSQSVISPNIRAVLDDARGKAAARGASEVTEADLVSAMLERSDSGGTMLLQSLQIDLEKLASEVQGQAVGGGIAVDPTEETVSGAEMQTVRRGKKRDAPDESLAGADLIRPNGDLDQLLFDEQARAALDEATLIAYRSFWPDLRSPHVFLGILNRPGSRLAIVLQQRRIADPRKTATAFVEMLSRQHPLDAGVRRPKLHREFLSENALAVLREAKQLAVTESRPLISELDLLRVILGDATNIITQQLRQSGIDPATFLWTDDDSDSDAVPDPHQPGSPDLN